MIFFALFTAGFTVGIFTALWVFPPNVKEIEEQERDTLVPILRVKQEKESSEGKLIPSRTVLASN